MKLWTAFHVLLLAGFCLDASASVRTVIRPSQVMWRYQAFEATLTVQARDHDYIAVGIGWGDGSKSIRQIDEDPVSITIKHVYKGCAPQIPVDVLFFHLNDNEDPVVALKRTVVIRVIGCGD